MPPARKYDKSSWAIKLDDKGIPQKDPTLQNPRCVLQLLKAHYSRYDLEKVSAITGTPVDDLKAVYEMYCSTGVKDKAGTILYALGWTQHTVGVQNIRTMAMIQLLLGNIGIAGGGVNALRGEPNVQGSTDQAILSHILPGYLEGACGIHDHPGRIPEEEHPENQGTAVGQLVPEHPKYMVSLLKTWYGDKATKENDFGYSWVPKLDDGQDAHC